MVQHVGYDLSKDALGQRVGLTAWRMGKGMQNHGVKPIRTKAYTSQTNGKAEQFIKTLMKEWAYAMPYPTSVERHHWLTRYLGL